MDAKELIQALFDMGMYDIELAEKIDVRPETVYKWVKGRKRIPDHYANIIKKMRDEVCTKQVG